MRQYLEIDAHIGGVNDLAFSHPNKQLCVITCGDDKIIKVQVVVQEKRKEYVIDSVLKDHPSEEVNYVFSVALMCLESDPTRRPTMEEVVKMLEHIKLQL
ncbi:receptor-like serine/threonine-protein kinase At1g78530 [Apium graveolens]|uniref:receptor-like serine/threonine-protein kinase At1g78530 n=1 Tax=Apium graveolens TaxID=4045 RepID=UPI003D7C02F2